jgi:hypothetical protein
MVNNQMMTMVREEDGEDGEAIVEGLVVLVVLVDRVDRVVHLMTPTMMMTTIMVDMGIEVVGIPVVVKIIITTTETMAMLHLEVHHQGL